MAGDDGFERRVVNNLNEEKENKYQYHAYRRKQHRFSSQSIDILVDSNDFNYYCGIECKSKQIDVEKANKDNNTTEGMLYFSQHFSNDKNGVNQVERVTEFLKKTGRTGFLAVAYRRGRGRKVKEYALPWIYVIKLYQDGEKGITKEFVEECGVEITGDYSKIFQLGKTMENKKKVKIGEDGR